MSDKEDVAMDCGCILHPGGGRTWCATGAKELQFPNTSQERGVNICAESEPHPPGVTEAQELGDRAWGAESELSDIGGQLGPSYLDQARAAAKAAIDSTVPTVFNNWMIQGQTAALISIAESLSTIAKDISLIERNTG